jgi:low affinity Fe/Cu permease
VPGALPSLDRGHLPQRRSGAPHHRGLEAASTAIARWSGSTQAFVLASCVVAVWAATGPMFGYSETWQLVINTGTTIVTFLMVFLIQRAQNKDALALQLKVNELVAATLGASNRLIAVEDLTEDELRLLHDFYGRLAEMAKREHGLARSHSVEEAQARHDSKTQGHPGLSRRKVRGPKRREQAG